MGHTLIYEIISNKKNGIGSFELGSCEDYYLIYFVQSVSKYYVTSIELFENSKTYAY